MGAGLLRQPGECRLVQTDAVAVAFQAVVFLAGEIDPAVRLVHPGNTPDGEAGFCQLADERPGYVVQIDFLPAASLRGPEESDSVCEEYDGIGFEIAGVLIGQDEAGFSGLRIGREELDRVLPAVEAHVGELFPVRRPLSVIQVDVGFHSGLEAGDVFCFDVHHEQTNDGIVGAGLGIALKFQLRLGIDIVDDGVLGDGAFVELHVGDFG